MKKTIVFLTALLVLAVHSFAATYYINNVSGNDANDGSSGSPWKTLTHGLDTFASGDKLVLAAGTYTNGSGGEDFAGNSAAFANNYMNKVSLWLQGAGADQTIVDLNGEYGINIDLHNSLALDSSLSTFEGFTFRNFTDQCFGLRKVANVIFRNNKFVGSPTAVGVQIHGVGAEGYSGADPKYCWNITVTNNTFESCSIVVARTLTAEVSGNYIWGSNAARDGIQLGDGDLDVTVNKNTVVGFTSQGIDFSSFGGDGLESTNLTVTNNIVAGNQQGFYQESAATFSGTVFNNNMFWYHPQSSTLPSGTGNTTSTNPRLVNRFYGDFRLYTGSSALGAASGGGNIGAYQGAAVSPWPGGSDVYISGSGNDSTGSGLSSDSPFRTISRSVDLEPTRIHLLAGLYSTPEGETLPIVLTSGQQLLGAGTGVSTIEGPNASNGATLVAISSGPATVEGITFRNFYGPSGSSGVFALTAIQSARISGCEFDGGSATPSASTNQYAIVGLDQTLPIDQSVVIKNCSFYNSFIGIAVLGMSLEASNNTFNNCAYAVSNLLYPGSAPLPAYLKNSVIANSPGGAINAFDHPTFSSAPITSSYNCLYGNTVNYGTGASAGTGDITDNPQFVSASSKDFRLSSSSESKSVTSPAIDAGDPTDDYSLEPEPNGGRINLGVFGGTANAELSWSPTPTTTTTTTSTTTTALSTTTTSTTTTTTTAAPTVYSDPETATINLAFSSADTGVGILHIVDFGPPERVVAKKVVTNVAAGINSVSFDQTSFSGSSLPQGPYRWYLEVNGKKTSQGKFYLTRNR